MRHHPLAPARPGGGDGEAHELGPQQAVPVRPQHRQPVALPEPRLGQRVEPDDASDLVRLPRRRHAPLAGSSSNGSRSPPTNSACSSTNTAWRTAKWTASSAADAAGRHRHVRGGRLAPLLDGQDAALTQRLLPEHALPCGEAGARLAASAARSGLLVVEAVLGQHRRHRAVDLGDVVGVGRSRRRPSASPAPAAAAPRTGRRPSRSPAGSPPRCSRGARPCRGSRRWRRRPRPNTSTARSQVRK